MDSCTYQLHVVIPRTYFYKFRLKFLSEESSHSPIKPIGMSVVVIIL